MKFFLSVLLVSTLLISTACFANQIGIDEDVVVLANTFNTIDMSDNEVQNFDLANFNRNQCQNAAEEVNYASLDAQNNRSLMRGMQFDLNQPDGELSISGFMKLSFGQSFEPVFKDVMDRPDRYRELGRSLDGVLSTQFGSHSDRMQAISQLCNGLNERERIYLVSNLGKKLSSIYDYDRTDAGGSSGTVVSSDMQYNAIYAQSQGAEVAAGVCRDAVSTQTEFAAHCGFDKDKIRIKGFSTVGGGHQIVRIVGEDGTTYNVNWSEMYTTDEQAGLTETMLAANVQGGLTVRTYDADGKLLAQRYTEVGNMAASAAGQALNIEDQREYNELQVNLGKSIRLRGIQGSTSTGDEVQSIGASYASEGSLLGILDTHSVVGMSLSRNERLIGTTSSGENIYLKQNIVFFGAQTNLSTDEQMLFEQDGHKLTVRGKGQLDIGISHIISSASNSDQTSNTNDRYFAAEVGGEIVYYNDSGVRVGVGADIQTNFARAYNKEQGEAGEAGSFGALGGFTPTITRVGTYGFVEADLNSRTRVVMDTNYITSRSSETYLSTSLGLEDSELQGGIYGTYVYRRDPLEGNASVQTFRIDANKSWQVDFGSQRKANVGVGGYVAVDNYQQFGQKNVHGGITFSVK
ncbi:MAG: hypothetical protein CME62_10370 [Halobacteriovoraceae bacterium]|nr:hypothetical protein [Halobacteriovoraceae bacterium]